MEQLNFGDPDLPDHGFCGICEAIDYDGLKCPANSPVGCAASCLAPSGLLVKGANDDRPILIHEEN